jgi:hypothetical protein
MEKIDFRKELKELYAPSSKEFSIVDVPAMLFVMIDGEGDPNTVKAYGDSVEALYSVSYALKFASRRELGKDYVVAPLEGLWTADDPSAFVRRAKEEWRWTMMMRQPSWISSEMVEQALVATRTKKSLPAMEHLRFETYEEGKSVQILHIGPYDQEGPTLLRLHQEYMPTHNFGFNGPHHEIYLGDPRKAAPSKLKTILRQPVKDSS